MSSPRAWVTEHRDEIIKAFDVEHTTGKARAFKQADGTIVDTPTYVKWLFNSKYKAELKGMHPKSIQSEIGTLIRKEMGGTPIRKRATNAERASILDKPKVFEVRLPGTEVMLMISTRDAETKVLFEVGMK